MYVGTPLDPAYTGMTAKRRWGLDGRKGGADGNTAGLDGRRAGRGDL